MPSYTLANLSALMYDSLDANAGLFPQSQITGVLNNSVRKINILTGFTQDTIPLLTQSGQLIYQIPSTMVIPIKVYVEGVEIEKYSLRELGTKYRNWVTDTTATVGPISRWCPVGIDQFVIHPMDAVGGRLIEVQGVSPITPMVISTNTVDLDDEQAPLLIDYARSRIMLKLGGQPFDRASLGYQKFIAEIKDMVIWQEMKFPVYYVESVLEQPGKGK